MKTKIAVIFLFLLLLFLIVHLLRIDWREDTPPIRFAITDIAGLEELLRGYEPLGEVLSQRSGLPIKLFPVVNRSAAVEALISRKVDLVLAGPAEYVLIRQHSDAEPIISIERPGYFAIIVTTKSSGISDLAQLKGKTVAFGDFGSTSRHWAPMQILMDHGVNPTSDIDPLNTSPRIAWEALKRGDVAAIGMRYDEYQQLRSQEEPLERSSFTILARGGQLPGDVILAGSHVDIETKEQIRNAFVKHSEELLLAMKAGTDRGKYSGARISPSVDDEDYDFVRRMARMVGYEISQ